MLMSTTTQTNIAKIDPIPVWGMPVGHLLNGRGYAHGKQCSFWFVSEKGTIHSTRSYRGTVRHYERSKLFQYLDRSDLIALRKLGVITTKEVDLSKQLYREENERSKRSRALMDLQSAAFKLGIATDVAKLMKDRRKSARNGR